MSVTVSRPALAYACRCREGTGDRQRLGRNTTRKKLNMSDSLAVPTAMQQHLGLIALAVKPKSAFGEEGQARNKAGVPKWTVTVAAESGSTYEITVASEQEPPVQRFKPVQFDGLVIGGSTRGLWWSATGAKSAAASHG